MKSLFRAFLINLVALYLTTKIIPGLVFLGGVKTLIIGAIAFMLINFIMIPLLRIMFLPLNLLTLGFFSWAVNVLAFYLFTAMIPQFRIIPYHFAGFDYQGFMIPAVDLNVLHVAILASFVIGFTTHLIQWLVK